MNSTKVEPGRCRSTYVAIAVDLRSGGALAAYYQTLSPDERKAMIEQLDIIAEEAARYGVSVDRFAKIMLDDDAEPPTRP